MVAEQLYDNDQNQIVMCNFIEDYLQNPSMAIASAAELVNSSESFFQVEEDAVYRELSSSEFRLYEEIVS